MKCGQDNLPLLLTFREGNNPMHIVRHKNLSRVQMAEKLRAYRKDHDGIEYSVLSSGKRTLSVFLPGSRNYFYAEGR